jgi:hypothetical protein
MARRMIANGNNKIDIRMGILVTRNININGTRAKKRFIIPVPAVDTTKEVRGK